MVSERQAKRIKFNILTNLFSPLLKLSSVTLTIPVTLQEHQEPVSHLKITIQKQLKPESQIKTIEIKPVETNTTTLEQRTAAYESARAKIFVDGDESDELKSEDPQRLSKHVTRQQSNYARPRQNNYHYNDRDHDYSQQVNYYAHNDKQMQDGHDGGNGYHYQQPHYIPQNMFESHAMHYGQYMVHPGYEYAPQGYMPEYYGYQGYNPYQHGPNQYHQQNQVEQEQGDSNLDEERVYVQSPVHEIQGATHSEGIHPQGHVYSQSYPGHDAGEHEYGHQYYYNAYQGYSPIGQISQQVPEVENGGVDAIVENLDKLEVKNKGVEIELVEERIQFGESVHPVKGIFKVESESVKLTEKMKAKLDGRGVFAKRN